jgi:hypothetical protein
MTFTSTKTSRNSFELQAPGETTLMQTAQSKMARSVENLSSEARYCRGIVGELKLEDGRLSYTARREFPDLGLLRFQRVKLERDARQPGLADRMGRGEKCVVFDARITDVEAEFPWYGGIKIRVGGAKYYFFLSIPSVYPEKGILGIIKKVSVTHTSEFLKHVLPILKLILDIRVQNAWKNALREQIRKIGSTTSASAHDFPISTEAGENEAQDLANDLKRGYPGTASI